MSTNNMYDKGVRWCADLTLLVSATSLGDQFTDIAPVGFPNGFPSIYGEVYRVQIKTGSEHTTDPPGY
jgi:hypothetical protein